jgi:hypothetical protein
MRTRIGFGGESDVTRNPSKSSPGWCAVLCCAVLSLCHGGCGNSSCIPIPGSGAGGSSVFCCSVNGIRRVALAEGGEFCVSRWAGEAFLKAERGRKVENNVATD